jgi:hypothetical protein
MWLHCGFPAERETFQDFEMGQKRSSMLPLTPALAQRLSLRLARTSFSSVTRRHASAATAKATAAARVATGIPRL